MGALLVVSVGGEVESVGLAAAGHRHVGPLAVGATGNDGESAIVGDAFGLVPVIAYP